MQLIAGADTRGQQYLCTPLSSERGYNDVFAPTPLDTYLSVGVYVCVGDMETPQHGNGTKIIFEEFPFF